MRHTTPCVALVLGLSFWARADPSQFNRDFGQALSDAQSTASFSDDLALSRQMLSAARRSSTEAGYRALLCEQAFQLALTDTSGYSTAADALELWVRSTPQNFHAVATACRSLSEKLGELPDPSAKSIGVKVVNAQGKIADGYAMAGDKTKADQTRVAADRLAASLGIAAATDKAPAPRTASQLKALLQTDPSDQQALREILVHHVVLKDDPASAGAYSAKVNDPLWRMCVPLAAKESHTLSESESLRLGKWYRSLAMRSSGRPKTAMLIRSEAYYRQYVQSHGAGDIAGKQAGEVLAQLTTQRQAAQKEHPLRTTDKRGGSNPTTAATQSADIQSDLLLRLTFDDTSADDKQVKDLSGMENHARSLGGATAQSHRGSALLGQVQVADSSSLRHEGSFTLSTWVYTEQPVQTATLLTKEPAGGEHKQFTLGIRGSDGRLFTYIGENGGAQAVGDPADFEKWFHLVVACRYDGKNSHVAFYKNGQPAGEVKAAGKTSNAPAPLLIGLESVRLDDVRVYGRALSPRDVATLFTADGGEGVDPKPLIAGDAPAFDVSAMEDADVPQNTGTFFGLSVD